MGIVILFLAAFSAVLGFYWLFQHLSIVVERSRKGETNDIKEKKAKRTLISSVALSILTYLINLIF